MRYPLKLKFSIFSFGQQLSVTDANDELILYVKQKLFRLKEKVEVYSDVSQTHKLFDISADRIIDFSANYRITTSDGEDWGTVRRRGMASLWSAHYEIADEGRVQMTIQEESPMKKIVESILGEIPLLGYLAIYWLNPSYLVSSSDGRGLLQVIKKPSIFERQFVIERLADDIEPDDELRALLSILMMALLEQRRG